MQETQNQDGLLLSITAAVVKESLYDMSCFNRKKTYHCLFKYRMH